MEYLIYISTAIRLLDEVELMEILTVNRAYNLINEITGVQLYNDGTFIQFLEGDAYTVQKAFERICLDPLHKNIIKLSQGEIIGRNFPDWLMGFKPINSNELEVLEGYFNPDKKKFKNDAQHPGLEMIRTFTENS